MFLIRQYQLYYRTYSSEQTLLGTSGVLIKSTALYKKKVKEMHVYQNSQISIIKDFSNYIQVYTKMNFEKLAKNAKVA